MPARVESLHYVNSSRLMNTGVPWHGLGTPHEDWMTDAEAKAALDWRVELRPLHWENNSGIYIPSTDSQAVVKIARNNKPVKQIATVGTWYEPFQNDELIDLGSVLVDDFGAKWDTVGSLKGDRLVFATLRLDVVSKAGRGLAKLEGTDYWTWFLLAAGHDGDLGIRGAVVKVRTCCLNTLIAGFSSAKSWWSIRHTGNMEAKAREAHKQIGLITKREEEFNEFALRLAETEMQLGEFKHFTEELFPVSATGGPKAAATAKANQIAVQKNWLASETIAEPIRKTRWGALNATTEWAEWGKTPRADKRIPAKERRMLSVVLGGPVSQIRDRAAALLGRGLS